MKAMILAAGEGTRLRPLTLTVPKPMIPIVGVPLLARTIQWLAEQRVTEVALNLYHRPQAILDYFGDTWQGVRLHYFFEETLRGTAGGVKGAEAVLGDAPFYVIYGDNLIHADLRRLADFHAEHQGLATIALFHHPFPTAAGIVGVEKTGRITRFVEKPKAEDVFSDLANAGVYVLDPAVLQWIPADSPSDFGRDLFPLLLTEGKPLYGTLLEGYLQDTGTPESYRQANWDILQGTAPGSDRSGSCWAAPSARVSASAQLEGLNVIGENAVIEENAFLKNCILWEGAVVGQEAVLSDCILGRFSRIPAGTHVLPGAILGENEIFG
jgi:NDP-sugar pyrophosphorylase family protein